MTMTISKRRAAASVKPTEATAPSVAPFPSRRRVPTVAALGAYIVRGGADVLARVLPPAFAIAALLAAWQIACNSDTSTFPSPLSVWRDSHELIFDPFFDRGGVDKGLFWHVATSLQRVGIGFGFAAVVGVVVGVLLGQLVWLNRAFDPLIQVLRTVPPLAWLPLSLAALREAQPSALFVIFITSIWPIIINTAVGVRNLPADYVNVGRVLRLQPIEYFFKILLPATTPYIFTGLRIGVGMSWLAIIASEMLLGGVGIGFFVWDQYNASRISDIIVALAWVGGVGFILDRSVMLVGRVVARGSAQG